MGDLEKCLIECNRAQADAEEISDGCARTIAAMYHEPGYPAGPAFSTSGAISNPTEVWEALFGCGVRKAWKNRPDSFYSSMGDEKILADMLGTYLVKAGPRGPVPGWSSLWVE